MMEAMIRVALLIVSLPVPLAEKDVPSRRLHHRRNSSVPSMRSSS